jgi:hypothetical protein
MSAHEPLRGEPDLDAPGKPEVIQVRDEHGNVVETQERRQSKAQNCAALATDVGGIENVTDSLLEQFGLTRREFSYFALDHLERIKDIEQRRAFFDQWLLEGPEEPSMVTPADKPAERQISRAEAILRINAKRARMNLPPITEQDLGYTEPIDRPFPNEPDDES